MRRFLSCALLVLALTSPRATHAGVTNPDISVIGQPTLAWNDVAGDAASKRPVFNVGETEFVFDAPLNPYARGYFTLSLADGQTEVEEAYFSLLRGLPGDIQIKGSKYRVGFGKLNPAHYGQQLIISRRLGNSASTPEISPAFLLITVNGIQDSAGSLRPYNYQEEQCA